MDQLARTTKLPTVTIAFDYARLSRDRKKLSENVQIQHRENRYFVEDQGWEYANSQEDNDISASQFSTKPREGYAALIDDIKNVPDREGIVIKVVIVVTEMPRLYRRVDELLPLIKLAESTKLSGIWTTDGEGYDLSTPEGIHRAIGAVNNAMLESNRASKRQLRKKRAQAAQGKYMGGQRRYGYQGAVHDEHGNITNREYINVSEVPEEIARWRSWFDRLIAGESQMSVVRDINAGGIAAPLGAKWTVGNFKRLMTNEAYVIFEPDDHPSDCPCLENAEGGGTLVHKSSGTKHRGRWRGLITRQQHELLLGGLRQNGQSWDHGMVRGRKYLLSGIAVCGGIYQGEPCGSAMYGNGRPLASGRYQRRYTCKGLDNHGERVACGKVFRDAEALDAFVTDAVLYRLDSPELARALVSDQDADQAADLAQRIAVLKKRRELIRRQYARGEIDDIDDYKAMRVEADSAIEELSGEMAKLRKAQAVNLLPADGRIREAWDAASIDWRRSVIQLVVRRIVVQPGHPGAHTYNGRRFNPDHVVIEWLH